MKTISYHLFVVRRNHDLLFRAALLTILAASVIVLAGTTMPSTAKAQTAPPQSMPSSPIEYHADGPPPPAKEFDSRPVTVSFERMPMERAIKQLLGPSNTAMLYGTAKQAKGGIPRLLEVRVLDLGVIPVLATSETPSTSPIIRMSPEALQARREEIQKRREERQARSNERRGSGGRRGNSNSNNQAAASSSGNPSSEQPGGQSVGGQSSGNVGNGSNASGGQPSESGAKSNGNGGGKQ
jgi:hypothetical protein